MHTNTRNSAFHKADDGHLQATSGVCKNCSLKSSFLFITVAHTAFYKEQDVLDFMRETLSLREQDLTKPLDPSKKRKLEKELKNKKVSG